jgi:hypothetical protein
LPVQVRSPDHRFSDVDAHDETSPLPAALVGRGNGRLFHRSGITTQEANADASGTAQANVDTLGTALMLL